MNRKVKFVSALVCAVMAVSSFSVVPVAATSTNGEGFIIADFDTSQSYEDWLNDYKKTLEYKVSDVFEADNRYRLIVDGTAAKLMDVEKKHPVSGFIKTNLGIFYATKSKCELYNGVIRSGDNYYICNTGILNGKVYTKEESKDKKGIRINITDGPNKGKVFVATPYTEDAIKLFKSTYRDLKKDSKIVMGTGIHTVYYKSLNDIAYVGNDVRVDTFKKDYNMLYKNGVGTFRVETKQQANSNYKYKVYVKYLKEGKVYKKDLGILGTDDYNALTFSFKIPEEVKQGAVYVESEGLIATYGFGELNKSKAFKNAVNKAELVKGFFTYSVESYYGEILN